MNSQNKQPLTASQIWLIHSLEVLILGAVFTFVSSVYQAVQGGTFTWGRLASLVISGAGAFLLNGIRGLLINAQTIQAVTDTLSSLEQSHSNLAGLINQLLPFLHSHPTPEPVQPPQAQFKIPVPPIPVPPPGMAVPPAATVMPPFTVPMAAMRAAQQQNQ